MQQKYYGDYDKMIAMRNADFKEWSELPTIQKDEYDVIIKGLKKEKMVDFSSEIEIKKNNNYYNSRLDYRVIDFSLL